MFFQTVQDWLKLLNTDQTNFATMKAQLIVVIVALHSAAAHRIDHSIVENIRKYWGCNVPSDIIQSEIAAGKEVVVGTTDGYYPDDTWCLYSYFFPGGYAGFRYTTDGKLSTNCAPLVEFPGVTYEPASGIVRYHVFSENGVTALYKCTFDGPVGIPEGLVKVRSSGYCPQTVAKAIQVLASLGINIVREFPVNCPC